MTVGIRVLLLLMDSEKYEAEGVLEREIIRNSNTLAEIFERIFLKV